MCHGNLTRLRIAATPDKRNIRNGVVRAAEWPLIHQAGIKRVVYQNGYRDTSGVDFLVKAGVEVDYIPLVEAITDEK